MATHAILSIDRTVLTVKIVASSQEAFDADLEQFKAEIDAEFRQYDPTRKVWIVTKPDRFRNLKWVDAAFIDRDMQLTLF